MEKTPAGTTVGVADPYAHVDRCDHLTDEGRCRWAREHGEHDPEFADARSRDGFRCPVACAVDEGGGEDVDDWSPAGMDPDALPDEAGLTGPWEWADCPHFRCRDRDRVCARCDLEERRMAHDDERPLLEEHHLSYADAAGEGEDPSHEITVFLCRWCHAKVHDSWARIDDDVSPDPEAFAERERRRAREQTELGFESAAERYDHRDRDRDA